MCNNLWFALIAKNISGEGKSIYSLLPRTSATGWHAAAVPNEPESHQVSLSQPDYFYADIKKQKNTHIWLNGQDC